MGVLAWKGLGTTVLDNAFWQISYYFHFQSINQMIRLCWGKNNGRLSLDRMVQCSGQIFFSSVFLCYQSRHFWFQCPYTGNFAHITPSWLDRKQTMSLKHTASAEGVGRNVKCPEMCQGHFSTWRGKETHPVSFPFKCSLFPVFSPESLCFQGDRLKSHGQASLKVFFFFLIFVNVCYIFWMLQHIENKKYKK